MEGLGVSVLDGLARALGLGKLKLGFANPHQKTSAQNLKKWKLYLEFCGMMKFGFPFSQQCYLPQKRRIYMSTL